jgi:hypothetical protein
MHRVIRCRVIILSVAAPPFSPEEEGVVLKAIRRRTRPDPETVTTDLAIRWSDPSADPDLSLAKFVAAAATALPAKSCQQTEIGKR